QARDIYLDLAVEFPEDAGIQLNLGLVQLKLGALEPAISALEKALALDARNERARQYLELARRMRTQGVRPGEVESHRVGGGLSLQPPEGAAAGATPRKAEPIPQAPQEPDSLPLAAAQPVTAFAASRLL